MLPELEALFTGITTEYRQDSAVRVNWPKAPFARGSASCYRPGQWARRGTEARRERAIHFCGEHCSVDFQGRLEGAVETGALAAAEILEDLNRTPVGQHAALVALKRKLVQPYSPEWSPTGNLRERVERVTETHAEFVAGLRPPSSG
jgi:hypothetical protein